MLTTSSAPIESHWMSSTLAQLPVIDFHWCWELSFVVPSFLYWKPCKPVYTFSFLNNYMLCVLVKYFHSNHNTTPVLPKICFSLQPPYHRKSCIHLNCDVYYIVDNFPVFVHPEKFSQLSHLFHLQTFQHNCLYYITLNATGLVLNSLNASQEKREVIHQYCFVLYKLSEILQIRFSMLVPPDFDNWFIPSFHYSSRQLGYHYTKHIWCV